MEPVNERRELAGGNALSVQYSDCSTARLYEAAVRCVTELGFALTQQNAAETTLAFRTPGPTPTWPGLELTVAISQDTGAARLVIGGDRFSGYRRQAVAYRGTRHVGIIFLDKLKVVLPTVSEPAAAAPAPASRLDQLRSLADLRNSGVLTDAEFDAEKKRLLG